MADVASLAIAGTAAVTAIGCLFIMRRREKRLRAHVGSLRGYYHRQMRAGRQHQLDSAANRKLYWDQFRRLTAPLMITSPDGQILSANDAFVEMLGYGSETELQELKAAQLYQDPRERETRTKPWMAEHGELRNAEIRFKRKDNTQITVLTTLRTLHSPETGTVYEGVFMDVTELRTALERARQLESQLLMAQKMEAIGQLASGIAHEINTPIQFVGDNTHFLKDAFSDLSGLVARHREVITAQVAAGAPAQILEQIDEIDAEVNLQRLLVEIPQALTETFDGIERVAETVRAMKEFAHPDDGELTATDINQAVQTTLVVARNEYKHIADIVTDFGDVPELYCRKGEINKVVLNLVVNAAHAMENNGKAERQGKPARRGTITISTREAGSDVVITIADTGCGIPPAVLGRIFDPFFTTKPLGKGTGQGLAIARSIIQDHGGRIEVASVVGKGTTFTISLPNRNPRPAADDLQPDEADSLLQTGNTG